MHHQHDSDVIALIAHKTVAAWQGYVSERADGRREFGETRSEKVKMDVRVLRSEFANVAEGSCRLGHLASMLRVTTVASFEDFSKVLFSY